MMHRPSTSDLLKNGESYYSLVVAVAKRAREITDELNDQGMEMTEKPVQMAGMMNLPRANIKSWKAIRTMKTCLKRNRNETAHPFAGHHRRDFRL